MTNNPKSPLSPKKGDVNISEAEDIDRFLNEVKARPAKSAQGGCGRLVFAMDATMSRQPTWDAACNIQGQMFAQTSAIGGLDVQLVFFRGFGECKSSRWASDPNTLSRIMTKVECRGGHTQIGKVLSHIRKAHKKQPVNAAVYVGDAMEEDIDHLCALAGELGLINVPLFMFQEGFDPIAEPAFKEIARLSGGAYCRFDASSAQHLRDLLSAVAVYAAGGRRALADFSAASSAPVRGLLGQMK